MKVLYKDLLRIEIHDSRNEMGMAAAARVAACILDVHRHKGAVNVIFAAAPSQSEMLAALSRENLPWDHINVFHMDEYIGLPEDAPQGFGNFLRRAIFDAVPFRSVNLIACAAATPEEICRNYARLLDENPVDVALLGIGENGHIAFNDPHVALFGDPERVKVVTLDEVCRAQQVNDGCFASIEDVPTHAVTLTIPALMRASKIICVVPASAKAAAVRDAVCGPVEERCPASILRTHPDAVLYLDRDSAGDII